MPAKTYGELMDLVEDLELNRIADARVAPMDAYSQRVRPIPVQ